jgi:hypothetical protein
LLLELANGEIAGVVEHIDTVEMLAGRQQAEDGQLAADLGDGWSAVAEPVGRPGAAWSLEQTEMVDVAREIPTKTLAAAPAWVPPPACGGVARSGRDWSCYAT